MKDTVVYIPIGFDCSISHYLRKVDLRKNALPFDWNVTPCMSALSLIKNDFEHFLNFDDLCFLPPTKRLLFEEDGLNTKIINDMITPVVCRRYGMLFPHDFSEAGADDYERVKDKYKRRISRFRDIISSPVAKVFIFSQGSPNDWQREQYKLSGQLFQDASREKIQRFFDCDLSIRNAKLVSFERIRTKRFKALLSGRRFLSSLKSAFRLSDAGRYL